MSDRGALRAATRAAFLQESSWLRYSSPLNSTLLAQAAVDDDLLDLGCASRPGQPVGLLFPIVAHFLLLKSPDPKLAPYFRSLTAEPGPVSEAFAPFRIFCLERRDEFTEIFARRTVNTNLVERASCIFPALAHVAQSTGEPLSLIEICCSSGMNLLFDEYHYDYASAGTVGPRTSPVRLTCSVIGASKPPIGCLPEVRQRMGIDLVKIDLSDPLERLWMEAALCPEWTSEREHLRAALRVHADHPTRIIMGNALDVLPSALESMPGTVCVLHTYCMGQWSTLAKAELDSLFRAASRHRDIHRLQIDTPDQETPETVRKQMGRLAGAGIPLLRRTVRSEILHTRYAREDARTTLLGYADGFGGWVDWH